MAKDGKGLGDGAGDDGRRRPTREESEKHSKEVNEYWKNEPR